MALNGSLDDLTGRLLAGDRRAAAFLIALVERDRHAAHDLMKRIYPHTGSATILGITGAGGAGKSTLTGQVIRRFRARGKKVGALLIDPSSPFSGGAFLGDRVRLENLGLDDGVYVRSMATRGSVGGLARAANDAVRIIEAMGMDVVIVETVGVGQDEIDIVQVAQTCLLVTTPGMGDDMQAMKAGVLEIADIIVLNKADLAGAETSLKNLQLLVDLLAVADGQWRPRLVATVVATPKASEVRGLDDLMNAIDGHYAYLHTGDAMMRVKQQRVEQEVHRILQDRMQAYFSRAMEQAAKKKAYLRSILEGRNDPYSVVAEILDPLIGTTEDKRA